jgi:hypothetical protein
MGKRKTISVEFFKEFVNKHLERTDDYATSGDFKNGLCVALERVLHETGNYKGYGNLYWLERGCDEWVANGKTEVWPDKKLFIVGSADSKYKGSSYARRYY